MAPWYSSETHPHNCKNSYPSLTLSFLLQFHSLGNWSNLAFYNRFLSYFIKVWMFCQCCLLIILLSFLLLICIWCFIARGFAVVIVGVINRMITLLWVTVHGLGLCAFSWCWDCFIFYVVFSRFASLIVSCHFLIERANGLRMMPVHDLSNFIY